MMVLEIHERSWNPYIESIFKKLNHNEIKCFNLSFFFLFSFYHLKKKDKSYQVWEEGKEQKTKSRWTMEKQMHESIKFGKNESII